MVNINSFPISFGAHWVLLREVSLFLYHSYILKERTNVHLNMMVIAEIMFVAYLKINGWITFKLMNHP